MTRKANELRPVKIKRKFTNKTPGSVLYQCGETVVLCTASVSKDVPPWMRDDEKGWITAAHVSGVTVIRLTAGRLRSSD